MRVKAEEKNIVQSARKSRVFEGKFNSMDLGKLVVNPRFLFRNKRHPWVRGDFSAHGDHIEFGLMKDKEMGMTSIRKYGEQHKPHAYIYEIAPNGAVMRTEWEYSGFDKYRKVGSKRIGTAK